MLPTNVSPLLHETAGLANINFFATLTNNKINKAPELALRFIFEEK